MAKTSNIPHPNALKDLTGLRFGNLIVIERAANMRDGATAWLCRCDCGKYKIIRANSLNMGRSTKCYNWCGKTRQTAERRKQIMFACKMRHKYGIGPEERNAIEVSQNGLCAICRTKRELVVDHDHLTGKVRGLLCKKCNWMIGFAEDSTTTLERGMAYLKKHSKSKVA